MYYNYGNAVEFLFVPVTLNATITRILVIAQFYLNNLHGAVLARPECSGGYQRAAMLSYVCPVYVRIKALLVHASAMASTRIIILIKVMNHISHVKCHKRVRIQVILCEIRVPGMARIPT
jgi:hypothetical protein